MTIRADQLFGVILLKHLVGDRLNETCDIMNGFGLLRDVLIR